MRLLGLSIILIMASGICPAFSYSSLSANGPTYEVDLTKVINRYVTVTMTLEPSQPTTELMMAVWTPGSYKVREFAKNVDRISAVDDEERSLKVVKTKKNRWTITHPECKTVTVTYRIYCNEKSVRTNSVGPAYAMLNGAPTFLTVVGQLDRPHQVALKMPENWKRSATSLRRHGAEPHQYLANNFDELVDSPIVAGNLSIYPFTVAGVEHQLVNVNERGDWDGSEAAADLAQIVEAQHAIWGTVPYDRYLFLNIIGAGGGGLEHDNCCLMMTGRSSFRVERRYERWLSLASHEFFHTWNIRRLRPKALVTYNYEAEVYTPSLWVAEGVTSYYEDIALARAGLIDQDEFVSRLSNLVTGVQSTEGRKIQSLRDSSHDAWIKFYQPAANSRETTISYYSKGALVAFLLDTKIRSATHGKKSLDDVLRHMYKQHRQAGYLPSDFRNVCSTIAGVELTDWFVNAVDSTNELEFQEAADWYGMQFGDVTPILAQPTKANEGEEAEPKEEPETITDEDEPDRWIGIGIANSPATRAGLADSDEVIAVNGLRLRGGLHSRLQQFVVGDPIELLIDRDGRIEEILVSVGAEPAKIVWSVSVSDTANETQTQRLESLLGIESSNEADDDKVED